MTCRETWLRVCKLKPNPSFSGAMSTALAELWENQADVRRRAMSYMIDFWQLRETTLNFLSWIMSSPWNFQPWGGHLRFKANQQGYPSLLLPIFQQLGTRVGVDLLYFHLEALYKLMKIPVDRFLSEIERWFSMDPDPQNSYQHKYFQNMV